MVSFLAHPV